MAEETWNYGSQWGGANYFFHVDIFAFAVYQIRLNLILKSHCLLNNL